MPNNKIWKKGLVVGIIVLFIGVAVAPSINAGITVKKDTIQKTIDSSVIETSDSEDDCNCNDEFSNIPEIIEKHEELSNFIISNNPIFDRPICEFLANQLLNFFYFLKFLADQANKYPVGSPMWNFYYNLAMACIPIMVMYSSIGVWIGCWPPPELE